MQAAEFVPGAAFAATLTSTVNGLLAAGSSHARALARVQDVNVLSLVTAELITSASNSEETPAVPHADATGTRFVHLTVNGQDVVDETLPPITRVELPEVGYVVLNRQLCTTDAGPTTGPCDAAHFVKLMTTAIVVVVTIPDNPSGLTTRTVIRVAEASSGLPRSGPVRNSPRSRGRRSSPDEICRRLKT